MKKAAKIILGTTLLLFLFRGTVFRSLITYHDVGSRPAIELGNQDLIQAIKYESNGQHLDINDITEIARALTTAHLSFTIGKASVNPNELVKTKKANCVGYAAMFNAIAMYMIQEEDLDKEYEIQHKIGKLEFIGIDLHQYSDSPFLKDHDYNIILNKVTKEEVAIDASVSDYLWVKKVRAAP